MCLAFSVVPRLLQSKGIVKHRVELMLVYVEGKRTLICVSVQKLITHNFNCILVDILRDLFLCSASADVVVGWIDLFIKESIQGTVEIHINVRPRGLIQ